MSFVLPYALNTPYENREQRERFKARVEAEREALRSRLGSSLSISGPLTSSGSTSGGSVLKSGQGLTGGEKATNKTSSSGGQVTFAEQDRRHTFTFDRLLYGHSPSSRSRSTGSGRPNTAPGPPNSATGSSFTHDPRPSLGGNIRTYRPGPQLGARRVVSHSPDNSLQGFSVSATKPLLYDRQRRTSAPSPSEQTSALPSSEIWTTARGGHIHSEGSDRASSSARSTHLRKASLSSPDLSFPDQGSIDSQLNDARDSLVETLLPEAAIPKEPLVQVHRKQPSNPSLHDHRRITKSPDSRRSPIHSRISSPRRPSRSSPPPSSYSFSETGPVTTKRQPSFKRSGSAKPFVESPTPESPSVSSRRYGREAPPRSPLRNTSHQQEIKMPGPTAMSGGEASPGSPFQKESSWSTVGSTIDTSHPSIFSSPLASRTSTFASTSSGSPQSPHHHEIPYRTSMDLNSFPFQTPKRSEDSSASSFENPRSKKNKGVFSSFWETHASDLTPEERLIVDGLSWFKERGSVGGRIHKDPPYSPKVAPYWLGYAHEVSDWLAIMMASRFDVSGSLCLAYLNLPPPPGQSAQPPPSIPKKVLDLGCGPTALWCIEMASQPGWENTEFTGLDLAPVLYPTTMLEEHITKRLEFVQHNFLEGLPFVEGAFDYVHMSCVGSGIPEDKWTDLMDAIYRVLAPGGLVEIWDANIASQSLENGKQPEDDEFVSFLEPLEGLEKAVEKLTQSRFLNRHTLTVIPPILPLLNFKNIRKTHPYSITTKIPEGVFANPVALQSNLDVMPLDDIPEGYDKVTNHSEIGHRIILHAFFGMLATRRETLWDIISEDPSEYGFDNRRQYDLQMDNVLSTMQNGVGLSKILEDRFDWKCEVDEKMRTSLEDTVPWLEEKLQMVENQRTQRDAEAEELGIPVGSSPALESARNQITRQLDDSQQDLMACKRRLGLESAADVVGSISFSEVGVWIAKKP